MAGTRESRGRSESHDQDPESSDPGSPDGSANAPAGKPGRKKNPNSQAARRDQNRIAQREFRLRKQQRIRDLEASVEILSGGKDAALAEMRKILKDLMQENQVLRSLLRGISSFIGEGAGGVLPKLGWDINDFENFVNRAETDTAWESFQRNKRDKQVNQVATSSQPPTSSRKRSGGDPASSSRAKRPRGFTDDGARENEYSMLVPPTGPAPPNGFSRPGASDQTMFNELMRNSSGSPMFMNSSSNQPQFPGQASGNLPFPQSGQPQQYIHTIGLDSSVPVSSTTAALLPPSRFNQQTRDSPEIEDVPDPKRDEASKLIHYHLDNYKRNSAYCLPSSLRPTLVQRTVPHESVIDAILHPEIRDRMILLRGRFDLVDCLHDYRLSVKIHGDDVLSHLNWEISEVWLNKYSSLVDTPTIDVVNRWRRERGDPELRASDFRQDTSPST